MTASTLQRKPVCLQGQVANLFISPENGISHHPQRAGSVVGHDLAGQEPWMLVLPQGVQGRMEQTASYDAYTYLSKRLKAELPGNSRPALTIPFLSPGSLELPSSTGKSLDFADATFSQHPLVTMTLCIANETHQFNCCLFLHFSLQTDPEH